jgi:hypothetical protein
LARAAAIRVSQPTDNGGAAMRGYKVAILGRGDHETRRSATPYNNRYRGVFEELIALGIGAQPVVYADDIGAEVRNQLLTFECGQRPTKRLRLNTARSASTRRRMRCEYFLLCCLE